MLPPEFASQSPKILNETESQRAHGGGRSTWAWPHSLRGDASAVKFRGVEQVVQVKAR